MSSAQHILCIEDEVDIQEIIAYNLEKAGYKVTLSGNGITGLELAQTQLPDLVLLDIMLPCLNGTQVCERLKADPKTQSIPIIMLSARSEEVDVVRGLSSGADDYITKPFSLKIFLSRVKASLRRKHEDTSSEPATLVFPDLEIQPGKYEVFVKGTLVKLTLTEFKILEFLAGRPGWVFTRGQIVDTVRGDGYAITDRAVDFQIVGLRKKLGTVSKYIETVRGVGYRFSET